jgi:superfamily II DNA helicase RecQ
MAFYSTNLTACRRVLLYRYFSEHFSAAECHRMCDNCKQLAPQRGVVERECIEVARAAFALLQKMRGPGPSAFAKLNFRFDCSSISIIFVLDDNHSQLFLI